MMGIIAPLLLVLLFPLNFLLVFAGNPVEKKQDASLRDAETAGRVKGEETEKKTDQLASQFLAPKYYPSRKTGVHDFATPNAHASLILDADSGTILHYANGKQRKQIASLTKLMTAVLVMEKVGDLDREIVTIGKAPLYVDGTRVGCPRSGYCITQRLVAGEKISAGNLLKAMLMNSANDAAVALGEHIAGSEQAFVGMMNEKAKELGLADTHFCTASGLEPEGREQECYSTAYDIGRIATHALKYDLIWETLRLPNNTEIASVDGKTKHQILNTDLVLDQIPNCLGGKTGYTPLAGRSLLMAATDPTGSHKVVAVLLDDPYRWQDIRLMLDWAFNSFEWK